MTIFLIIVSALLWLASVWALFGRQLISPILSWVAFVLVSFIRENGIQLIPINGIMLSGWLAMSLVVMFVVVLQPEPVKAQTRGMAYIVGGGIVGLVIGLLGNTFVASVSLLYAFMILCVIAGIFFGFLLYTNTPDGKGVNLASGNFFKYLLAKGFPTAITLMQLGIVLVLVILLNNVNAL